MLNYPVNLDEIEEFEKINKIPINVFKLSNKRGLVVFYRHKIVSETKRINLLLIKNENTTHYVYIRNLNGLLKDNTHTLHCCDNCLQRFQEKEAYDNHINNNKCEEFNGEALQVLPTEKKKYNYFKGYKKRQMNPFVIYADMESQLKDITNMDPEKIEELLHVLYDDPSKTKNLQLHVAKHVGIKLVSRYPELIEDSYRQFDGDNAVIDSLNYIMELQDKIINIIENTNIPYNLTEEEQEYHNKTNICWLCNGICDNHKIVKLNEYERWNKEKSYSLEYDKDNIKVIDHDHLNGSYRGPAHKSCNLKCNLKKYKLPVFFHNGKGYDSHFIFQYAGLINKEITVIPLTDEKYLSYTIDRTIFLDSFSFISTSLEKLVNGLKGVNDDDKCFKVFNKEFDISNELKELLKMKGVFPYDWYNSDEKLLEQQLPKKEDFYSMLNNENCSEENYNRAKRVYELSRCKNFKDYLDLYLKTDVILLADCFEYFRDFCYKFYGLDPIWYLTAPGFSWDAMLYGGFRKHKINNYDYNTSLDKKLFISCFQEGQEDMLNMIKSSMRGGISVITHRYSEANNKYMKNYNPDEDDYHNIYLDANNLYGAAMSKYIPLGHYKWNDKISLNKILSTKNNNYIGYIVEVDLEIPIELHDYFNDYPLAVENTSYEPSPYMKEVAEKLNVKQSKVNKLIPNLYNKTKYVTHYQNLKLFWQLGLKITKLHRVLQFEQKPFLQDYIMFNTNMRSQTKLDYEKDLFKLFNNAIFGKTMENVEKRIDVRLINDENTFMKHVCKPYYKSSKIFSNNLCAIHLNKTEVIYDKPIGVGYTILELSKHHMYDFHYNVMKKKYNENLKLLFTDTDSLCYRIKTKDLYEDMKEMSDYFDFSDYPEDHKCYSDKNKKVIGKFKDECNSKPLKTFAGIRSKMYKIEIDDGKTKGTMKGIKTNVSKNIDIEAYKNCLFSNNINDNKTEVSFNLFQNKNHIMKTISITKTALCSFDDKRYYINSIDSYAHGHYKAVDMND
jgi:hypothetical protein